MTIVLTIIHIIVSLFLILVVLAQQGKGQDLASAFGGGGSSAAFGARGTATLLSKITTVSAVVFMLTSLGLSYFRPAISGGSVVPDSPPPPVEGEQVPGAEQPGTESETPGEPPMGEDLTPDAGDEPAEEPPAGEPGETPEPKGKAEGKKPESQ
jgi:preprotein translocase subunit SecG